MYMRLGPIASCLLFGASLSAGLASCKDVTGGRLGSQTDEVDGQIGATGGKIRALAGQLDFEIQANGAAESAASSAPASGPAAGQPSTGQPAGGDIPRVSIRTTPQSANSSSAAAMGAAPVTIRMEFGIGFDLRLQSLENLASSTQPFRKVGTLTTFNIVHAPSDEKSVTEEIGRPLYHVVDAACAKNCFRLVTGAGRSESADASQVILFEFLETNGQWVLKGFNYFGKKVKDYGMPVRIITADRFDGM
jgi:hypothetical protein